MISSIAILMSCLVVGSGHYPPPEGGELEPGPGYGW
ncbi:MAG: hypothetical protein RJA81_205, partial [Planctomycetota bacterium]